MTTHQDGTGPVATTAPDSVRRRVRPPARRPRGTGRGLAPDARLEVRFDPRLELAECLLHRGLDGEPEERAMLLRQVRHLLLEVRHDQGQVRPDLPSPRRDEPTATPVPALLTLDELLLDLADDQTRHRATHRARRIMHARQLLHDVREESEHGRWHDESRLRLLAAILNLLERPGSTPAGHPDAQF
ncbi:hypothetical protein [Kineosporia sp. NBRC 101731]|uniref:hypothetical protein n=1 Tax=Kineosporia sp. NBRC 101731 TaxID=3032199 RepID=UPI0024A3FE6B|nr:hypothetical protein [Kineosporia sp. NBRC 101731]GLY30002.1 hypothetical protein Kisp02_33670 [Kineosporia sp. NBRC 101731]